LGTIAKRWRNRPSGGVCAITDLLFSAGHCRQVEAGIDNFAGSTRAAIPGAPERSRVREGVRSSLTPRSRHRLDQTRAAMSFGQAIASGFSNYANFSGRASWSEFWFWVLFAALGAIVTNIIDAAIFVYHPGVSPLNSPLSNLFTLVALWPSDRPRACGRNANQGARLDGRADVLVPRDWGQICFGRAYPPGPANIKAKKSRFR
jgi:hypothetical protein